jgi:DNA-binding response OmpR family regulator
MNSAVIREVKSMSVTLNQINLTSTNLSQNLLSPISPQGTALDKDKVKQSEQEIMQIPTILVVDDEKDITYSLEFALKQEGYQVTTSHNGKEALDLIETKHFDLVILDLMLPGMNGFDVCKEVRGKGNAIPIIMLTAKTTEIDAVIGLELGADDYIPKPARIKELIARVRTRLRNSKVNSEISSQNEEEKITHIELGSLFIDLEGHEVKISGKIIDLTQREFELLKTLALNPNRVFDRNQLLEGVWGWSFIGESRTVDVHIRYLREKLEKDPANPDIIKTIRGIGYKLVPPVEG